MKSVDEFDIGIVGMGTMGRNLLLNIADHGFSGMGLDKDPAKIQLLKQEAGKSDGADATDDLKVFLQHLKRPRAILLLVPAGEAVDSVINELLPLLAPEDLIIDAGNSHFRDTDRREAALSKKQIHFFGMGVSGGESGARHGPSIMPGGNHEDYARVQPILEAIAAQVEGSPCVAYLGSGSAGHYVKMVHNGIEYGLMQLIAETYFVMKSALKLSDDECHTIYKEWNESELNSYLLEITAKIFLKKDTQTDNRLIDVILDVAKQKGTGKWTSQDAMELQVPVPTIDAAVGARDLSTLATDRERAQAVLSGPKIESSSMEVKPFLVRLRNAYYFSSIVTYAQGMALLQKASTTYNYDLNLESIARIWRGGCIIRASVLQPIMAAYQVSPRLSNLLLDERFVIETRRYHEDLRAVVRDASSLGLSIPALMSALAYYDGLRSAWLPANLIQAQRDYFGAHTYARTDEPGVFHSQWEN